MNVSSKKLLEAYIDLWNRYNIFGKIVFNIALLPFWLMMLIVWVWLDILVLIFIGMDKIFKK
jgi:hypothetical protein